MTSRGNERLRRARPVIAIDGPVGAGKSTVARGLARALGFSYVNTGAMYRAVAMAAREAGIAPDDAGVIEKITVLVESMTIAFDGDRLLLNGRDISASLAEPEVGDLASRFSTIPVVRARMRKLQRAAGGAGGVVMEGRDIGSAVFPDAEVKFFLDADVSVRAERRFRELQSKGVKTSLAEVSDQLMERDRRDRNRTLAPLVRSPDAIVIDSTNLDIPGVIAAIKEQVERRFPEVRA